MNFHKDLCYFEKLYSSSVQISNISPARKALSPAQVTFIPQQPAESWKGRWSLPSQLQTCFFLRTQQVITQQGKRCLGTMQSKEFLKFHHGVFASLRDKQNQTRLNTRGTGRAFNVLSNSTTELSSQDIC